jgi:hypothetical protein
MRGSEKARNQTLAIESWMESKKVSYFFTWKRDGVEQSIFLYPVKQTKHR